MDNIHWTCIKQNNILKCQVSSGVERNSVIPQFMPSCPPSQQVYYVCSPFGDSQCQEFGTFQLKVVVIIAKEKQFSWCRLSSSLPFSLLLSLTCADWNWWQMHSELVYLSIPLDMHRRAYNILTVKHISYQSSTARIAACVAHTEVSIINIEWSRV